MNDGGHAFPNITPDMMVTGGPGMSLRDWFAGQALAGLCASRAPELVGLPKFALAEDAYMAADAMLYRRDQQPPTRE